MAVKSLGNMKAIIIKAKLIFVSASVVATIRTSIVAISRIAVAYVRNCIPIEREQQLQKRWAWQHFAFQHISILNF